MVGRSDRATITQHVVADLSDVSSYGSKDGSGQDLSGPLMRRALVPMEHRDRIKQLRAKAQAEDLEALLSGHAALTQDALHASAGNPGLQDVLTTTILNGEAAAAEEAIAQIEAFQASGATPESGTHLGDLFARMTFEVYAGALTGTQKRALGAAAIFSSGVPIPRAALLVAISESGVADPERALDRLLALCLMDDWGEMSAWSGSAALSHHAVNPLAGALGADLSEEDMGEIATAALPHLGAAWQDDEGDFPFDPRGVEAAGMALKGSESNLDLLDAAAQAAVIILFGKQHNAQAALKLGMAAFDRLQAVNYPPGPALVGKLVNASEMLGMAEV